MRGITLLSPDLVEVHVNLQAATISLTAQDRQLAKRLIMTSAYGYTLLAQMLLVGRGSHSAHDFSNPTMHRILTFWLLILVVPAAILPQANSLKIRGVSEPPELTGEPKE